LTIDIFCANDESFTALRSSKNISTQVFARIFQVDPEKVKIFFVKELKAIKVSMPRQAVQGHAYERDMHCGQQYTRILDLEI
jgi:hypothetical protein